MLIDKASDRILGFTVFGAEASELMATVQTAMLGQLPFTVLRDAIFTHPTAAEGLTVLLADVATRFCTCEESFPINTRWRAGDHFSPTARRSGDVSNVFVLASALRRNAPLRTQSRECCSISGRRRRCDSSSNEASCLKTSGWGRYGSRSTLPARRCSPSAARRSA